MVSVAHPLHIRGSGYRGIDQDNTPSVSGFQVFARQPPSSKGKRLEPIAASIMKVQQQLDIDSSGFVALSKAGQSGSVVPMGEAKRESYNSQLLGSLQRVKAASLTNFHVFKGLETDHDIFSFNSTCAHLELGKDS